MEVIFLTATYVVLCFGFVHKIVSIYCMKLGNKIKVRWDGKLVLKIAVAT